MHNVEKAEAKVETPKADKAADKQPEKPKGPTLFEALGEKKNKRVLNTLFFVSALLVVVGFGSFFLSRKLIPILIPSVSYPDAGVYACVVAVVLTQIIVFGFYFYAKDVDTKEYEEDLRKAKKD